MSVDRTWIKVIGFTDTFFTIETRSRISEEPNKEYRRILNIPYECLKNIKWEKGLDNFDRFGRLQDINEGSKLTLDFECTKDNMIGELVEKV